MNLFRNLTCEEIEVRRGRPVGEDKTELLLYKTARTDYNLLDETFGPYGWACQYKEENGILFCGVALKDPKSGVWVWKWNSGAEGNFEKEKAVASSAMKRACAAYGLGRELYSAPRIVVAPENQWQQFYVKSISYDDKDRINNLVIENDKGQVVFSMKDGIVGKIAKNTDIDPLEVLKIVCSELKESEDTKELLRFYKYYEDKIVNWDSVSEKVIYKLWNKWNSNK